MSFNARSLILMGLAIVVAGVAALLAYNWVQSNRPAPREPVEAQQQRPAETEILVAKTNLPAGTILNADHLRWQEWPRDAVAETFMVRGRNEQSDVIGAVVKKGIPADIPMTSNMVVRPHERGFLSAVLTQGMRAVSVPINQTTGIAGFVFPGDRIDLILTLDIETEEGRKHNASETILTNVRVLAIDQRMNDQSGTPTVAKVVTVEVTPRQAEQIAVARQLGPLSLSLRSLASEGRDAPETADLEPSVPERGVTYTWDSHVSKLIPDVEENKRTIQVNVARGDQNSVQNFKRGQ